jgi:protein SCO1/2
VSRLVLLALLILFSGPASAQIAPQSFQSLAFRQHPGAQLPLDAELVDESGKPTTLGAALGQRPAVVILEYLHCSNLCGLVLHNAVRSIADAHMTPGRDFDLVAISIDPRDTPHDAAAARTMYAGMANPAAAVAGLHFLTGPSNQVGRIAAAVGFPYRYDPRSGQFAHPAGFVVTTPDGRISRYMLGISQPADVLRQAIAQARSGTVTPPAHPFLLLCFGYDPDPGSVPALVLRLVRWGSLAVVLGLALLVFALSRRRRSP